MGDYEGEPSTRELTPRQQDLKDKIDKLCLRLEGLRFHPGMRVFLGNPVRRNPHLDGHAVIPFPQKQPDQSDYVQAELNWGQAAEEAPE